MDRPNNDDGMWTEPLVVTLEGKEYHGQLTVKRVGDTNWSYTVSYKGQVVSSSRLYESEIEMKTRALWDLRCIVRGLPRP